MVKDIKSQNRNGKSTTDNSVESSHLSRFRSNDPSISIKMSTLKLNQTDEEDIPIGFRVSQTPPAKDRKNKGLEMTSKDKTKTAVTFTSKNILTIKQQHVKLGKPPSKRNFYDSHEGNTKLGPNNVY
jgi:hypothetical protein